MGDAAPAAVASAGSAEMCDSPREHAQQAAAGAAATVAAVAATAAADRLSADNSAVSGRTEALCHEGGWQGQMLLGAPAVQLQL